MIYIYPPGTRDLSKGGIPLPEAKNDKITEVLNGRYDLEFDYPVDGTVDLKHELEDFSIIGADTARYGVQPFVVTRPVKGEGHYHIEAKHVFFLLEIFSAGRIHVHSRVSSFMRDFQTYIDNPKVFSFASDIDRRIFFKYDGGSAMDALAGGEESILGLSRGELERDGYYVGIKDKLGEDTEYLLAERKNIKDTAIVKDYTQIVTRLNIRKKIDHAKFIPKENGKGRLATAHPKEGGTNLRVRYFDGTTGELIKNGEGTFQVFDGNGYSVLGGMQTGSIGSIGRWNEKKAKYEESLKKEKERKTDLAERQKNNKERLAKQQKDLSAAQTKYNGKKTESNKKSVESKQKAIENTKKSIANTDEQIKKNQEKINEYEKLIKDIPTVILGERLLEKALPKGEYFIRMVKPAEGYKQNKDVKRFIVDGTKEVVINFNSNPETYDEDDTIWTSVCVESPIVNEYPYVFSQDVELDDEDLEVWDKDQPWILNQGATRQNLFNWGYEEFLLTRMDLPLETLSFTAGSEVIESGLGLGDRAVVHFSDYDLYKDLPVTEIEYSPMQRKYLRLSFGDNEESPFSSMARSFNSKISKTGSDLRRNIRESKKEAYESAREHADAVWRQTADRISLAELEAYFDSEYIKSKLMEYVNQVGEENISLTYAEIIHMHAKREELEALYGTLEERNQANKDAIDATKKAFEEAEARHQENLNEAKALSETAKQEAERAKSEAERAKTEAGRIAREEVQGSIDRLREESQNWDLTGDGRNYFSVQFVSDYYAEFNLYTEDTEETSYTISQGIDAYGKRPDVEVYGYANTRITTTSLRRLGAISQSPLTFKLRPGDNTVVLQLSDEYLQALKDGSARLMINRGPKALPWQPHYLDVEAGMYDSQAELRTSLDSIRGQVVSLEGSMSTFEERADSISSQVANLNGDVSSYKQAVDGFKTQVINLEGQVSDYEQSVQGFKTQVANLQGDVSSYEQSVQGFKSQVANLNGDVTRYKQSVDGFRTDVSNLEGKYSSFNQSINEINLSVGNLERNFSSLKLTVDGLKSDVGGPDYSTSINQLNNRITMLVQGKGTEANTFINMLEHNIKLSAENIDLEGYVTFSQMNDKMQSTKNEINRTQIHGSRIITGTISADRIATGYLTAGIKETDRRSGYYTRANTWIDLNTGQFSFMNGAFMHKDNGQADRGEIWCTSSFAITFPSYASLRMFEFNAGGLYAYSYDARTNTHRRVGNIRGEGKHLAISSRFGGGGIILKDSGDQNRVLISNNIKNNFGILGLPYSYQVYIIGDLMVTGDIHAGKSISGNRANGM